MTFSVFQFYTIFLAGHTYLGQAPTFQLYAQAWPSSVWAISSWQSPALLKKMKPVPDPSQGVLGWMSGFVTKEGFLQHPKFFFLFFSFVKQHPKLVATQLI